MTEEVYAKIEQKMIETLSECGPAHDKEHIYRVLATALCLAEGTDADLDVLTAACLLHDIGRPLQIADPTLCHAEVGSQIAKDFLLELGFDALKAEHVSSCILTHRFRNGVPKTLEGKILFDSDKLDAVGVIGIARTLLYQGEITTSLYTRTPTGEIDESPHGRASFLQEYNYKLKHLYDNFYTEKAKEIAHSRQSFACAFYNQLMQELTLANQGSKR